MGDNTNLTAVESNAPTAATTFERITRTRKGTKDLLDTAVGDISGSGISTEAKQDDAIALLTAIETNQLPDGHLVELVPLNTSSATGTVSVDNTAGGVLIPAVALTGRRFIFIQNVGNKDMTIGFGTVVFGVGPTVPRGTSFGPIALGDALALKGITSNGATTVNFMELS